MQPVQKALTVGDAQGMVLVVRTLERLGAPFSILPESSTPLPAIRKRRAVVFGSPWYSQTAATLLENTGWTTAVDPETKDVALIGRGKQAGKNCAPERGLRRQYQEVFGLLLPGDPGAGDGRTMALFSGLTPVGSRGAAEFITSPKTLEAFRVRLRAEGIGGCPRSYQLVVRRRATEDTQMLSRGYEARGVLAR